MGRGSNKMEADWIGIRKELNLSSDENQKHLKAASEGIKMKDTGIKYVDATEMFKVMDRTLEFLYCERNRAVTVIRAEVLDYQIEQIEKVMSK